MTTTSYEAASHTRRVTDPDASYVDYAYDGFDRLVRRESSAGVVTLFFHDRSSEAITIETDASGTAKNRYVLSSTGEALAQDLQGASTRGYFVTDPRDNVVSLLDQNKNVVATYGYDPYGKERPALTNAVSGWDSRLRFQSAPRDPKTGAYALGPRMYDPAINRFVGADMYVGAAADMALALDPLTGNRYLYAGANPANFIDDGHQRCWKKRGKWKCGNHPVEAVVKFISLRRVFDWRSAPQTGASTYLGVKLGKAARPEKSWKRGIGPYQPRAVTPDLITGLATFLDFQLDGDRIRMAPPSYAGKPAYMCSPSYAKSHGGSCGP